MIVLHTKPVPVPADFSKHGEAELERIHRENDRRFVRLVWYAMLMGDNAPATARAA